MNDLDLEADLNAQDDGPLLDRARIGPLAKNHTWSTERGAMDVLHPRCGGVDSSDDFSVRWVAHNVRAHTSGVKRLRHPVVGDLDLPYESFPLPADPTRSLVTYTADPDSPSQERLDLVGSWIARAAGSTADELEPEDLDT